MKKLLVLLLTLVSFGAIAQNPIKFRALSAVGGATLDRGGTFEYIVQANGNGNSTTRQVLVDMQYDQNNFELVSVNHTGTGGNGGVLPSGATISLSYTNYPNYTWNAVTSGTSANNTTNGTNNYTYSNYTYNGVGGANAILRTTLTWSTTSAMPYTSYDRLIVYVFRLKAASTAYTFNPIKLNFVAGWNGSGVQDATLMESPLSTAVIMNQNFGKFVSAKVDLNSNLYNLSSLKVSFRDTLTNQGQLFSVLADGTVDINQSLLAANTVYDVSLMHDMDKTYTIYNSAITISDFSTAQAEFTSMGLGSGGKGVNLNTGQALYAADINRNKVIDGGDLPRLLGQVAGKDTLMVLPSSYTVGSGGWMSLPTWRAADATTVWGDVEWAYISPNSYSTGVSALRIDMRQFPQGTTPNQIKSIQLFDVYTGPIEYMSEDGTWALYKVPSSFTKASDGTSTYVAYIRQNTTDYSFRANFEFNTSVNNSWGAITTTNWNNITYPRALFKTGTLGANAILDLKYLLWGDVNRSHSSQVVTTAGGSSTIQTNAVPSLVSNSTFTSEVKIKSIASTGPYINTDFAYTSIDVNLTNQTITANTIEIPVNIDTKGNSVGGLQLEFAYDPTKIKFEEMISNVPNSWFVFANAKEGIVKFGALDQNNANPIKGINMPFKLKFSTIGDGVDILTSVKVSQTMDAADSKGNQLGVVLNMTNIKLTGYNNF
jgi:arginine repressor